MKIIAEADKVILKVVVLIFYVGGLTWSKNGRLAIYSCSSASFFLRKYNKKKLQFDLMRADKEPDLGLIMGLIMRRRHN